jgi:mannose-1-phosphate guanylyltransferase
MKAVILVGGEGTRLKPLTDNTVKAMMPVLNKPFIQYVLEHLKYHHIDTVILAMGYKPDSIKSYFDAQSIPGINLIYSVEADPLGTAGAVKNAQEYINEDETFFVLNGDIFTDMNFTDILSFHRVKQAKATIALTPVDDPTHFGVVESDTQHKVKRFIEKPDSQEVTTNLINAGIYILEAEVLDRIPHGKWSMFERDIFPQLAAEGEPVYGYIENSYWIDMGTPDKYTQLNFDLLSGKCASIKMKPDEIVIGPQSNVHPEVTITGPVYIDTGCTIGKNVTLTGPLVIGKDCVVNDGATVEKSVIWQNVRIGEDAKVSSSIVIDGSIIEEGVNIINTIAVKANEM